MPGFEMKPFVGAQRKFPRRAEVRASQLLVMLKIQKKFSLSTSGFGGSHQLQQQGPDKSKAQSEIRGICCRLFINIFLHSLRTLYQYSTVLYSDRCYSNSRHVPAG